MTKYMKVVRFPFLGNELGLMIKFIFQRRLSKFIYFNTYLITLLDTHYCFVRQNIAICKFIRYLKVASFRHITIFDRISLTSNSECQKSVMENI